MAAARRSSELFSNVDAAWLHMDKPTNLANVTGVLMFDEPIDFIRLAATIEHRLLPFERFVQRVREPRLRLGTPRWETDPHFDLSAHLHRMKLPPPGDQAALQKLAGDLMSTPLDFSRPLWHMYFVENYGRGCALIPCLHHCISDGLSLVQVLLSMTDTAPDAPWPKPVKKIERHWNPIDDVLGPAVNLVSRTAHSAETLVNEGWGILTHPHRFLDLAGLGASNLIALSKLVLLNPDRATLFKGKCGVPKRTVWSDPIQLPEVKAVGHALGSTLNDVLLAAVVGALRRYLEDRGEPVDGLNIRAMVPVNLRPPDELDQFGNRFGLVLLSLPIGVQDPIERLRVLKRRMDEIKDSPEAVVAFGILGAMGITPAQVERLIVQFFSSKATAVMTNVPGPREVLYLAGKPIKRMMFWVPQPGDLSLGVSIISYAGEVMVGVATDAGLAPDPDTIVAGFQAEFEMMKQLAQPASAAEAVAGKPGRCRARTKAGKRCKNSALAGSTLCRVHQRAAG